jgi:hypothetical protein
VYKSIFFLSDNDVKNFATYVLLHSMIGERDFTTVVEEEALPEALTL